jgi:predicted site-specific integrase-resolvase
MPDLVPLQQVADELKVHRTTLYRYINAGRLTAYSRPFDNRTYLDREELAKLLEPTPRPPRHPGGSRK